MTDEFETLISLDPLGMAEKITGKSYKDDETTSLLGFLLLQKKSETLQDEMLLRDDTYRSNLYEDTLRIIVDLGFTSIFSKVYTDTRYGRNDTVLYNIYWCNGVMVETESYSPGSGKPLTTNVTNLYGNWIPAVESDRFKFTESGGFTRKGLGYEEYATVAEVEADPWVWVGHWTLFEGLRNTVDRLDNAGIWLEEWVKTPFFGLICYAEDDGSGWENREKLTTEKVNQFPAKIRDMINRAKEH